MPVFPDHNLVFVHIPKTGGTSVLRLLAPAIPAPASNESRASAPPEYVWSTDIAAARRAHGLDHSLQHCTLRELRRIVPADVQARSAVFAVVRDPFERVLSDVRHVGLLETHDFDAPGATHARRYAAVLAALQAYLRKPESAYDNHRASQATYLRASDDGDAGLDPGVRLLRFEALADDLAAWPPTAAVAAQLGHHNSRPSGAGARMRYGEYRYGEVLALVRDAYADDFRLLGYPVERAQVEVVVARYREPLGWVRALGARLEGCDVTVHVYDKGGGAAASIGASPRPVTVEVTPLANEGREADTYVRHLLTHGPRYAAIASASASASSDGSQQQQLPYVVFLQGAPGDHAAYALPPSAAAASAATKDVEAAVVRALLDDARGDATHISRASARDHAFQADHRARPSFALRRWRDMDLTPCEHATLGEWYAARFSGRAWPSDAAWWCAAQFCARADVLARVPRAQLTAFLGDLRGPAPMASHFLERAWLWVLDACAQPPLQEEQAQPPLQEEAQPPPQRKTPVICTTSENYQPVYAVFRASIAPCVDDADGGFRLLLNELDLGSYPSYGFGTDAWHRAILEKLRFVLRCLQDPEQVAEGEYAVVSDADVQVLRPDRLSLLVDQARARGLQYYGMRENTADAYNGGFYIVQNTSGVRAFFADLIAKVQATRLKYADQELLNELLTKGAHAVEHGKIDGAHCVWGAARPCAEAIFHHAVGTTNNAQKLAQLKTVRERFAAMERGRGVIVEASRSFHAYK